VSRLPIRVRLALAFALAVTAVLAVVGGLLYVRLGESLQEQVDEALEGRARTLSGLVDVSLEGLDEPARPDDAGFTQVLGSDGSLRAASAGLAEPLLSPAEVRAVAAPRFLTREKVRGVEGPVRLLVSPLLDEEAGVVVVGASLEDRDEALAGLLRELLLVGPLALGLASLGGYLLAGAALRPVEAMRRHAAEVSTESSGRRLPLPEARDEIRRLGETLNEMLGRLESGLARERQFVADASHELRTPLALLRTELELALRQPRPAEELVAALGSAAEEVERLTRLAEDLLVLARVNEEGLALRRSDVPLDDFAETVAGRFAARGEREGRPLAVEARGAIMGDRLRLEQALSNLVDNAFRHGSGEVRILAREEEGEVEISVSDEGPGFPPDFLPRAFDRFTRADEARGNGSAGLGLALVDAVARAHGGSASAANCEGGGASVSIRLPASG